MKILTHDRGNKVVTGFSNTLKNLIGRCGIGFLIETTDHR